MASLKSLSAVPGLMVVCSDDQGFLESITSKAFNARIASDRLPEAVIVATTVPAVQAAVKFCSENNLKVSVRSGGHSWHSSWLHGKGSVILDVGDLNTIEFHQDNKTVSAGPGGKGNEVLEKIPDDLFFSCGHCPGVPIGGYILGGGFGIGSVKYGIASTAVVGVEAVLASGEVVEVTSESTDEVGKAIMHLIKGVYSGFPGVVTKYTLKLIPRPKAVLSGTFVFELSDWRKALTFARDISHRGDDDATAFETAMILGYAPPPLAEATGAQKVSMVLLFLWGDDEEEARALYQKYTKEAPKTLVPPEEPTLIPAQDVPVIFGAFYPPEARYDVQVFATDESYFTASDDDVAMLMDPIVSLWKGNDTPPPPSHSIFVPLPPTFIEDVDATFGFRHSFLFLSNMIYKDETLDDKISSMHESAHRRMREHPATKTEIAEGNLISSGGAKECFSEVAFERVQKQIKLLDPSGVFSGFHG
jgi:hypothetical protein